MRSADHRELPSRALHQTNLTTTIITAEFGVIPGVVRRHWHHRATLTTIPTITTPIGIALASTDHAPADVCNVNTGLCDEYFRIK